MHSELWPRSSMCAACVAVQAQAPLSTSGHSCVCAQRISAKVRSPTRCAPQTAITDAHTSRTREVHVLGRTRAARAGEAQPSRVRRLQPMQTTAAQAPSLARSAADDTPNARRGWLGRWRPRESARRAPSPWRFGQPAPIGNAQNRKSIKCL
eukprot:3373334-Pleurochrysis_carterae.AAC.1